MFRTLATAALRRNGVVFTVDKSLKAQNVNFSGLRVAFFSSEDGSGSSSSGPSKGTVKWFDVKKGFGFLVPDDASGDVFVHQTAIHAEGFRSLMDGEPVEFEVLEDDTTGRRSAQNVTGPDGQYVQGRPRPQYNDYGSGGFGGQGGGGFGGQGGGGGFGGGNDGGFGGGPNY
eukprot:CAMPEP_0195289666 /NCGR_PEP_ID=MMETSP0707-20130614/5847_1 /TAXON_ID=33640 /ORGANISM="Asterionellopsis glacialis, Strain CCMP134" /LENGTH=171 /DNA_ID=CAMNT_0040349693 /DNA_START=61 /DNA_END=576 /DNA_ORIENTATION=+